MSAPHPLNQAVVAQALHDLRNGQLRRCLAMGFGERELDALKQPALLSILANARVPWCSVTINHEVLWRLISQMQDIETEINTVDKMLKLGASTEMVCMFFGLNHQEVALRREVIGLPKRKGRHAALNEQQETELWRQWRAAITDQSIELDDDKTMLYLTMHLAESMGLPMSVIWSTIRNWIAQGLTE